MAEWITLMTNWVYSLTIIVLLMAAWVIFLTVEIFRMKWWPPKAKTPPVS
jgi:hypothetical protein